MIKPNSIPGRSLGLSFLSLILRIGWLFLLFLKTEASRHNGDALETPWVTLEINDLGRPNLGMSSWSSFFTTSSAFSVQVGKPSIHPVNVSIMTNRYLYP